MRGYLLNSCRVWNYTLALALLVRPCTSFSRWPSRVSIGENKRHIFNYGSAARTTLASKGSDASALSPSTRRIVGSIAAIGAVETAFLTANKGAAGSICASASCGQVLSGPWSSAFGLVPLSLLGFLSYVTVFLCAVVPLAFDYGEGNSEDLRRGPSEIATLESLSHKSLVALTSGMAAFSAYLVGLLLFKLQTPCLWCFASATFSAALAFVVNKPMNHFKIGASGASIAAVFAAACFFASSTEEALAETTMVSGVPQSPPPITTHSSKRAKVLAEKLKEQDAKMYGAFWCSHCFDQKQALGMEAMSTIPYVECAPNGVSSQTSLCRKREIPGYPTWEIKGELHPGEMSLDELEEMVGIRPTLVELPGM